MAIFAEHCQLHGQRRCSDNADITVFNTAVFFRISPGCPTGTALDAQVIPQTIPILLQSIRCLQDGGLHFARKIRGQHRLHQFVA